MLDRRPPRIGLVHLRRALLLFAIVLGLAAIAASVSRPRDDGNPEPTVTTAPGPPTVEPAPEPEVDEAEVYFDASSPREQGIQADEAATVYVSVPQPSQVEIPDLGLSTSAEPLTAARFDVLTSRTGRFAIMYLPPGATEPEEAGTLVVRE
jgi:hypothetical protein